MFGPCAYEQIGSVPTFNGGIGGAGPSRATSPSIAPVAESATSALGVWWTRGASTCFTGALDRTGVLAGTCFSKLPDDNPHHTDQRKEGHKQASGLSHDSAM